MPARQPAYDTVPFAPLQRQAIDWLELNRRRHMMHALVEADITAARRAIRAYRSDTGAPLSLTGFLLYCLARAVAGDPGVQAYRWGRRRLVRFAQVDVGIMVERDVEGVRVPVPAIIRAANRKSPLQIQQEIAQAQAADPAAVAARSLPGWLQPRAAQVLLWWLRLPSPLRRLLWRWALWNPRRRTHLTGTVGLTAMSMYGHGTGWGVAPMGHTLTLLVGGISHRPALDTAGRTGSEHVCLTLTFDHDIIAGAPAARFTRRLIRLIESAAGLPDPARQDGAGCDPGEKRPTE
jgi:pyruvate/2-oxoglutarate dehydrogenase complex dihydrolipoamide acyltransferase (E2) component